MCVRVLRVESMYVRNQAHLQAKRMYMYDVWHKSYKYVHTARRTMEKGSLISEYWRTTVVLITYITDTASI